jgi:hypothetical protein
LAGGAIRGFHPLPAGFHFLQRQFRQDLRLRFKVALHRIESAVKFFVGMPQASLRIEVQLAGEVSNDEQQIPNLIGEASWLRV